LRIALFALARRSSLLAALTLFLLALSLSLLLFLARILFPLCHADLSLGLFPPRGVNVGGLSSFPPGLRPDGRTCLTRTVAARDCVV
jgi:hypothetical protein